MSSAGVIKGLIWAELVLQVAINQSKPHGFLYRHIDQVGVMLLLIKNERKQILLVSIITNKTQEFVTLPKCTCDSTQ